MERSLPTGASTFAVRTSQHTAKTCKRAFTFPNAEKESQWLTMAKKHRGLVVFESSELLTSPPIQNFDNKKRKVNYKNIWLG